MSQNQISLIDNYFSFSFSVVPHITDAIQEWVENVAKVPVTEDGKEPEVCIIELGGTIGDIEGMPFVEAFRQFQFRVSHESFCCVHVSLVPQVMLYLIFFYIVANLITNSIFSPNLQVNQKPNLLKQV